MKVAYVDSSVWIALFEGLHSYSWAVDKELIFLEDNEWNLAISESVLLEVLLKPKRQQNHILVEAYNEAFSGTLILTTFIEIFSRALTIAQTENLKAMDAIHVAFAVHYECELFVTTDPHYRNLKCLPLHMIDLSQITTE